MTKATEIYDVLVIGGGVNGAGIAADAAGRGLNVFLCEQNDLASATSSNSSKLIHGGLRYLEHYEFRLVREALAEREVLLRKAPHIIKPLSFRLPHQKHLRPKLMIKAGLFLYDHLAKRVTLPASKPVKFTNDSPLNEGISYGFEYSDGWVDDARLVVLNAVAAKEFGATICTQTQCLSAKREQNFWIITLLDKLSNQEYQIKSKAVINASGPWVASLFESTFEQPSPQSIRLVKGSHIVVPKVHNQEHAYMLQNADQRIVFVIPYEQDYSLIGTTDVDYQGDPGEVKISEQEIDYLVDITNSYFKQKISKSDVITTFSGVRPLLDDESDNAQSVTRDYTMELSEQDNLPLLSIFGGKITTYRTLSEAAVNKLAAYFPQMSAPWTADVALPGGNFSNREELVSSICQQYSYVDPLVIQRFVRSYGTKTRQLLANVKSKQDLGINFCHGLYQIEIDYLVKQEWAISCEDILWRRTKLGLKFTSTEIEQLKEYLTGMLAHKAA